MRWIAKTMLTSFTLLAMAALFAPTGEASACDVSALATPTSTPPLECRPCFYCPLADRPNEAYWIPPIPIPPFDQLYCSIIVICCDDLPVDGLALL